MESDKTARVNTATGQKRATDNSAEAQRSFEDPWAFSAPS